MNKRKALEPVTLEDEYSSMPFDLVISKLKSYGAKSKGREETMRERLRTMEREIKRNKVLLLQNLKKKFLLLFYLLQ